MGVYRQFFCVKETITRILQRGANDTWHLDLTETQIAQFVRYAEMLVEWNATRMNLTRIISPPDIAVKHFLDSLALLTLLTLPAAARVLDIGTGAGLPGLALKIARPDLRVTLLDSTAKKLLFCRTVAAELGFNAAELASGTTELGSGAVEIVHARAEEVVKRPDLAEQFDLVVARAVAPLETLLPLLTPFAAPDGQIAALKGASVAEEMTAARSVARRLGLKLDKPYAVKLPEAEEETVRQIVVGWR